MKRLLGMAFAALVIWPVTACDSNNTQVADPSQSSAGPKDTTTASPPTLRSSPTASSPKGDPTPNAADLKDAVKAYSDAFLTGDGKTAFGMLSTRCQERTNETEFVDEVTQTGDQYGHALDFAAYDAHVSSDLARVTYTYASAHEIDQDTELWVFEDGAWREDDC